MTVREMYDYFNQKIPVSLSCDWDNDGLMCCPLPEAPVKKVLIALDVTAEVVKQAIKGDYDVILSHHPLIFSPLRALEPSDHVARKVIDLVRAGIAVMSFHTRLDAVSGGVNDALAEALELKNIEAFGENGETIGRVGTLDTPITLAEFAARIKQATRADAVQVSDAGKPVYRVAVLGGSGSDDVRAARNAGADTYVSGELKHNYLTDAPECGMNLVAAGHFYTENVVCDRLRAWVLEADASIRADITNSNPIQFF